MDNKKIAEMIGLTALVLSLVFLGYELKRGNDIAEAEAAATVLGDFNEFSQMLITDDDAGWVWSEGLRDHANLDAKNKRQFRRLFNYALNISEMNIKFIENGLVDDEYMEYYAKDLCGMLAANAGITALWEETRHERVRTLTRFVDSHCELPAAE